MLHDTVSKSPCGEVVVKIRPLECPPVLAHLRMVTFFQPWQNSDCARSNMRATARSGAKYSWPLWTTLGFLLCLLCVK